MNIFFKTLFFLCVLLVQQLYAQQRDYRDYFRLCNEALRFQVTGETETAITFYEKAFSEQVPFLEDLDKLKACYKLMDDTNMIMSVWKRKILTGFTRTNISYLITLEYPLLMEWNANIPQDEQSIFERINYDSLHQIFMLKNINVEKDRYMQALITSECFSGNMRQYYRDNPDEIKKYCSQMTCITDFIGTVSYVNNGRLFIALAKSGFLPSRAETAWWEDTKMYYLLEHIAASLQGQELDTFLNILWSHVEVGDITPEQYASMFDVSRHGTFEDSGYYGCVAVFSDDVDYDKLDFTRPIQEQLQMQIVTPRDVENVDKRRAEIYLPPLWVSAKQKNMILPKSYKP
ncbi:MAG: hypothetical protein LBQ31_06630 [Bacteroidales bacterium]|jgi:hypothetical protein|nr:hypothetical protein [Bacteroidales bacterium]